MTDPTNFMKMFFPSISLYSMTPVSEEKEEKDEGLNAYHVPVTGLVTLGIFFFHLVLSIVWIFFFLSLFYQ